MKKMLIIVGVALCLLEFFDRPIVVPGRYPGNESLWHQRKRNPPRNREARDCRAGEQGNIFKIKKPGIFQRFS